MTKVEFYERYKENPDVSISDLYVLINEEELWEDIEIRDRDSFTDWIDGEVREILNCDGWTDARDFLERFTYEEEDADWYLFEGYRYDRVIDDDDIPYLLDKIEDTLSSWCGDWLDEGDPENPEVMEEISILFV